MDKAHEIIQTLRHCSTARNSCRECPRYNEDCGCLDRLHADAAALLEELLTALKRIDPDCRFCTYSATPAPCEAADCDCSICKEDCACKTCRDNSNWQWRDNRRAEDG